MERPQTSSCKKRLTKNLGLLYRAKLLLDNDSLKTIYFFMLIYFLYIFYIFFNIYLGFLLRTFTNHQTTGEGGGHVFNSSLPLPPNSQTIRHQQGNYFRQLTSTHSQQPDPSRELLVSERKWLTTKLEGWGSIYFTMLNAIHY